MDSNSIGAIKPTLPEQVTELASARVRQAPNEQVIGEAQLSDVGVRQVAQEQSVSNEEAVSREQALEQQGLTEEQQQESLESAIDAVASFIEPQIRNVNFTQDDNSGQTVIKVFDAQSQELIKQFPSDEILELAERIKGLQDEIVDKTGILIDDKV
ncbi:hypothetical protein DXX93_05255 [Thalassotalea euphylliae]|uniref:Flagellar biosynthesis protein FlaG n=1 Tax=Thalassotalea euphylliae TaxID=1655234 RepID=A0A3E0TPZ1_9GAMM|nr:flagellar protein FlaG [Thalassotalea euphylliae]REL26035.1 hypothetical protein DXX93_05255 [Thalassotalea euphylliae]